MHSRQMQYVMQAVAFLIFFFLSDKSSLKARFALLSGPGLRAMGRQKDHALIA